MTPTRLTIDSDLHGLYVLKVGRKSSPDPLNPGKSVKDQFGDLDLTCERHGLVEFDRIDEDVQGASIYSRSLIREKFERAMRIIAEHNIAVLAFWDLSRSARRLLTHSRMMEALEENNTLLLVGNRLYDAADPNDRLALGVNAIMDEQQVARTRAASMRGMRESAKEGRPHGVQIMGYRRIYDPRTKKLTAVEIEPAEAAIITEIVDRILDGDSARSIARDLTTRRIPRPRETTKTWYTAEIRDIVDRDAYMGKRTHTDWRTQVVHGTVEAIWPAIVPEEKLRRARAKLNANTKGLGQHKGNAGNYLLTGLFTCGRCKDSVYSATGTPHKQSPERVPVYKCRGCGLSRDLAAVDQTVIDVTERWLNTPELLVEWAAAAGDGEVRELVDLRAALNRARQELDEGYDLNLTAKGMAALERQWLPEIERLEKRIAELEIEQSSNTWHDLATGKLAPIIPAGIPEARRFLANIIRVELLPLGRGQRFMPTSIRVVPIGIPKET